MPTIVARNLLVSGYNSASKPEILARLGIKSVVTVCEKVPDLPHGIPHHVYKIPDCTTLAEEVIASIISTIKECRDVGRTLVHCAAGHSRSVGFVSAAIALDKNMTWDDAYDIVERRRSVAAVHPVTAACLRSYVNGLQESRLAMIEIDGESIDDAYYPR